MILHSPTQVAEVLGVSKDTVLGWTRDGIITAEVREQKIIRYDLDKVRGQLAKRAKTPTCRPQLVPTI
jgi:predicted site-specific integrase-resolvase